MVLAFSGVEPGVGIGGRLNTVSGMHVGCIMEPILTSPQSNIAHVEGLMEKLNSALLAGEIPFLFTSDEMEGLLQSLQV